MEDVLYYLLKVAIGTAVFYIAYHFLFQKSKHFVFNRFYLVGSFIASFIIPHITFKASSYLRPTSNYFSYGVNGADVLEPVTYATEAEKSIGFQEVLLTIYLVGVIYFFIKLVYGYRVAARIQKRCREKVVNGINVYVSEDNVRAFTFLNKIIIGKNILNNPSIAVVLNHESVHSREKHFYDILIAELLLILQWFNPFGWLHSQAIRNNLEFRADDMVIKESDIQIYLSTMLSMVQNRVKLPLFTELNSSNLKKRIIMMKSKNQNRFAGLARLLLVPVFAVLLVSLSEKETVAVVDDPNKNDKVHQTPNLKKDKSVTVATLSPDPVNRHYIDIFFKKHGRVLLRGKEVPLEDISGKIVLEVEKLDPDKYSLTGLIKTYTEIPLKQILDVKEIFNNHGIEDLIIDTVSYKKPTEVIVF
ncbi:M56 family metallopeptidase [Cyclobacterium roseum]|uniref:M56 family metallopeptidase n=1 Tax=Cyclobacterium roseum TaxID=2666137 RepID=UPI001390F9F1|nr:M56 family metallopeptidase [Cyclobacterium roseum]